MQRERDFHDLYLRDPGAGNYFGGEPREERHLQNRRAESKPGWRWVEWSQPKRELRVHASAEVAPVFERARISISGTKTELCLAFDLDVKLKLTDTRSRYEGVMPLINHLAGRIHR